MIKVLLHKDTISLTSGFVKYREAKGTVYDDKKVRSIYIRVSVGINMDVQIPLSIIDWK